MAKAVTGRRRLGRAAFVMLPAVAGLAIAAWLIGHREDASPSSREETAASVRTVTATEVAYVPRGFGHGPARPARVWRAVAEVAGTVVSTHDELHSGAVIPAGDVLIRIDPSDYDLAVAEAEAAIASLRARLDELGIRERTLKASLGIEQRALEAARRAFERQRALLERGTSPQAAVDRQERDYLRQRQVVQDLDSALATLPAKRRRVSAELDGALVKRDQRRRDVERTEIRAPFDLRVERIEVEAGQRVGAGEILFRGYGVDAAEVEAQMTLASVRALLTPLSGDAPMTPASFRANLGAMKLSASVGVRTGDDIVRWDARVDRIGHELDPKTRTAGVVVVVDRPYETARPPERPPLVKGMHAEVTICAPPRPPEIVIPQAALNGGQVYVANADNRLETRAVEISHSDGAFAVVREGLREGDRVIVSDPVPAVAGRKLAVHNDPVAEARLIEQARGEAECG